MNVKPFIVGQSITWLSSNYRSNLEIRSAAC